MSDLVVGRVFDQGAHPAVLVGVYVETASGEIEYRAVVR